ncbi:DUF6794 domain-containing protein [Hymenobacter wooponensis]|uniref:DUF6794 domain-containing protein n=1 Tax=Hymenobacter wooponensis TaxID=1525360 RepID=A0A4Z0MBI2_9BACT|nr:DUF6794 domain-containing protein [Hymenobacter wooponensis]TGD76796.1 hypothetical protein EU557_25150 [Hymenobacter wooponensis]
MLKRLLTVPLFLSVLCCSAQSAAINKQGFYVPQNLTEANEQLDKVLSPKAKAKFKQLTPSDFENVSALFILDEWELGEWQDSSSSRLVSYLNTYVKVNPLVSGYAGWQVRRHLVLLSYLRHLQNQPFDLAAEARTLNARGDSLAQGIERVHRRNLVADSIDGVYIPRDIRDSFGQLDRMLSEADKQELKHPDAEQGLARFHFGLGLWMRNNWQLWGGSRLQQYFERLGITHPDDMSGTLLRAYSAYLNGQVVNEKSLLPSPVPTPVESTVSFTAPAKQKRSQYSKPYREFLRKRRIADFNALPPEAYGEEVEIEK